jgi:hypothetical protein
MPSGKSNPAFADKPPFTTEVAAQPLAFNLGWEFEARRVLAALAHHAAVASKLRFGAAKEQSQKHPDRSRESQRYKGVTA